MSSGKTSVVKSAFLTISMRWIDRLIGLASTLILARILVPADFGIIAMASVVIGLADVLLEMGVHIALLQNKSPTPAHYDTAWTVRLIQTSIMTVIVVLAAPLAAIYFNEPRLTPVIQVLALTFVFEGLENIWIISFQKEMKFTKDFRFMFIKRVMGFLVTITLAFATESYWALVAGNLAGRSTGVALSYIMHTNRPRLCLSKFREIFSVSQWVLVQSIGRFLNTRLHTFVVGGRTDAATMGAYSLAGQIAAMPSTELLAPLNRVLFPMFVKVKDDLEELKRVFMLAQGVQTLIAIPAAVGLCLISRETIIILLGEKWLPAAPFVEVISLLSGLAAIVASGSYLMITLGKIRVSAMYSWIQVVLFAVIAIGIVPDGDAMDVVWQRFGIACFGFLFYVTLILRYLPTLKLIDIITSVWRPVVGALAMAGVLNWANDTVTLAPFAALLVKVGLGATTYVATVLTLWKITGLNEGAEAYVLRKLRKK
ncbi:MAG TPA: lipopolysaccharide biosynthesis protein [Rhodocyclaceae bacterium]|nr:lipopolysaccharide biosynthesis protein [Rhodocyclaceae bacterium]